MPTEGRSFVLVVFFYCWKIAAASGVPLKHIFPFVDYMKVVVVSGLACLGAGALKLSVSASAAVMLPLEILVVLVSFAIVGTLTGLIQPGDWRYVWGWVRLDSLRSKPEGQ